MNINDYTEAVKRTVAESKDDNIHMILGMVTEVGELADVFKKNMAYGKPIDWVNINEEIGDLMWYLANFCRMNNLNLEDILSTNVNKLMTRYPDKFTKEAALVRNLDEERAVLEGKSKLEFLG